MLRMRALGIMGVVRSMRAVAVCVMTFGAAKENHVSFTTLSDPGTRFVGAFSVQINNECTLPSRTLLTAILAPFAGFIFAFPEANHL